MKRRVKKAYTARHLWRLATAPVRTLPDFLIIGAQKSGTTFLYQLLVQHPHVKPAFVKEVHYFDLEYRKGVNWYRSHFPLQMRNSREYITGEASPYYLFHPHAPRRASAVVPDAKLVVLALVVNMEGFIKYSSVHEGNIGDCDTLSKMIDKLSSHTLKEKKAVIVLDAGIATEDNLKLIEAKGYKYL